MSDHKIYVLYSDRDDTPDCGMAEIFLVKPVGVRVRWMRVKGIENPDVRLYVGVNARHMPYMIMRDHLDSVVRRLHLGRRIVEGCEAVDYLKLD